MAHLSLTLSEITQCVCVCVCVCIHSTHTRTHTQVTRRVSWKLIIWVKVMPQRARDEMLALSLYEQFYPRCNPFTT